jgi:D-alanine-D-alanine ligase-like ATP-grasp enzyme
MADSVTRQRLIAEVERRGWKYEIFGSGAFFCKVMHPDGRWEMFHGSEPMRNSAHGLTIAQQKDLTMDFLASLGFKVPPYCVVMPDTDDGAAGARDFLEKYTRIVVKPVDGEQSRGVTIDVTDEPELKEAIALARKFSLNGGVMLQEQLDGRLYRLFVLDGRIVAASERRAAVVLAKPICGAYLPPVKVRGYRN